MDYSALEAKYQKVETGGISAYAGFQNIHDEESTNRCYRYCWAGLKAK